MKKILIAALLLSAFSFPHSALKAQQPDAVYKLLRYEWTVNQDGSSDYHYRHEVQILRNRALTAYADKGETFVVYNPDIETLTVNEVYTLRADGSRVDMPQNAFVYQLPSECADCGRLNHIRELAMVHTGMELGCVIVVDYTIHRQHNLVYTDLPLMRECPVEKLEIKLNMPAGMEMQYRLDGEEYLPAGLKKEDICKADVTLRSLPQAPREAYMPQDYVPTLHLYNGGIEFTPALTMENFDGASDAVAQVMTGKAKENIEAMRNFVVDNIHLNDIDPLHLGYHRATPAEVWQSGCGTATEKAALLAAMLNHEGYTARVTGEDWSQVAVMIDTLEYLLSIRHKSPLTLAGEAKDEVKKLDSQATFDAVLDTLEDGFFGFPVPTITLQGNEIPIRASKLPLTRTTPLQGHAYDIKTDETFNLPKGMKMVGNAVSETRSYEGIGSVEISIKQSGKKLRIVRNLRLEKSLVPVADYAKYRELLAVWERFGRDYTVLLRKK